jgi:hypothetical protein
MTTSSVFYGFIGIGLTFVPKEISEFFSTDLTQNSFLILQLLGAAYLGFAMLNWMTKNNLIGGIYSRPLALGNLAHFLISSLALIKITMQSENSFKIVLTLAVIYSVFTLFFGYVFMMNPSKVSSNE